MHIHAAVPRQCQQLTHHFHMTTTTCPTEALLVTSMYIHTAIPRLIQQLNLPREVLSSRADPEQPIAAGHYSTAYTYMLSMLQDESLGMSMKQPNPAGSFRMMCNYLIHCDNLELAKGEIYVTGSTEKPTKPRD